MQTIKQHRNDYPLDKRRDDEKAFSEAKPLTIVVTKVLPNEVQYRLFSSPSDKSYYWRYIKGSPLKPSDFVVGEAVGINNIIIDGKYIWISKFQLTHGFDKYKALTQIDQDTLLNLLSANQFGNAQELYYALCQDFDRDQLDHIHAQFVDDFEAIADYWDQQDDPRTMFIHKWIEPAPFDWSFQVTVDDSMVFSDELPFWWANNLKKNATLDEMKALVKFYSAVLAGAADAGKTNN